MRTDDNQDAQIQPKEAGRNDRRRSPFAFSLLANWIPAATLLAALFMPQVTGCDNLPVRPMDKLVSATEERSLTGALVFWQHFYGLFVLVLFATVFVSDRATSDKKLAIGTTAFWAVVVGSFSISLIVDSNSLEPGFIFAMLPFIVFPSYIGYVALRRRDWISAWARLASSIAVLGMLWTYLSYLFNRGPRYGIFVTYGSLLLLALAPWWLRVNWRRALIGASEPTTPIRFGIWHLLAASTFMALLYAYYSYLVPLLDQ